MDVAELLGQPLLSEALGVAEFSAVPAAGAAAVRQRTAAVCAESRSAQVFSGSPHSQVETTQLPAGAAANFLLQQG